MNENTDHRACERLGRHLVVGALVAAATIGATSASASVDMFLKLGDIKGESTDDKHKDEIGVLAWSWGVLGPTLTAKKEACSQPLTIRKNVDLASTAIMTRAVLNTTIPTAKLTLRKSGDNPLEFLVLNLSGVTVKMASSAGSEGSNLPVESVEFGFTSATLTYTPQDASGLGGPSVSATLPASCP